MKDSHLPHPNFSLRFYIAILGVLLIPAICRSAVAQTTVTGDLAAPAGSVNQSEPGFLVRVHQIPLDDSRDPVATSIEAAERLLAGQLIDISTGQPYANVVDDVTFSFDANGFYAETGTINYSLDFEVEELGNFGSDTQVPGIPGQSFNYDDYAMEVLGFLELSAGTHRLGVNGEDGFKFTIGVGTNPADVFAVLPEGGLLDGTDGGQNVEWELEIEEAGFYPFRLLHYKGKDFVGTLEFYSVNPADPDGTRILINDAGNPDSLNSYRSSSEVGPAVTSVSPRPGQQNVFPRPTITILLEDGDTLQVDGSSVSLSFDDADVTGTTSVNKSGSTTTVQFTAAEFLVPNTTHTALLSFSDTGGNSRSASWSFTVSDFSVLPPEIAVPISSGLTRGFNGKVRQAHSGASLPATVARANAQLRDVLLDPFTGSPFSSEAGQDGFTVDTVNFVESLDSAEQPGTGNFSGDQLFPGIPGNGGHTQQFAVELTTYLELSAGIYVFGVNSQDGFDLSFGADARDVFDAVSVGRAEGTRPLPMDDYLVFQASVDGLYPFRLIQFESNDDPIINFTVATDGAALEFFSMDANAFAENPDTAVKTLVNDSSSASSIKAWRAVSGEERTYVKSVLPAPGSNGVPITTNIEVVIANLDPGVQVSMTVNGQEVAPTTSVSGSDTRVSYDPDVPFEKASDVSVVITYGDTTNSWTFAASSGEIALMFVNNPTDSDLAIRDRLVEAFGFDVILLDDDQIGTTALEPTDFGIDDATQLGAKLIYNSSTVDSRKVAAVPWPLSGIPFINVEQADLGRLSIGGNGGIVEGNTVTILQPDHPMAAGFPAGDVPFVDQFLPGGSTGAHVGFTEASAEGVDTVTVVATLTGDGAMRGALVAIEEGHQLTDGSGSTTARMVQLALAGDNQYPSFNENGVKLFDAAIAWALGIEPPDVGGDPAMFTSIALDRSGAVVFAWDGDGVLEFTEDVDSGIWTVAPNQNNPQTIAPIGTRFYRIRN